MYKTAKRFNTHYHIVVSTWCCIGDKRTGIRPEHINTIVRIGERTPAATGIIQRRRCRSLSHNDWLVLSCHILRVHTHTHTASVLENTSISSRYRGELLFFLLSSFLETLSFSLSLPCTCTYRVHRTPLVVHHRRITTAIIIIIIMLLLLLYE